MDLIHTAKKHGVLVSAFQQTIITPAFLNVKKIIESGKLGEIHQINVKYSNFKRRWDWQTLQSKCAGGLYNTGPHPIGQALALIDWDESARVAYSSLKRVLTSGDGDDYAKILIAAPDRPLVDIEITSIDAYTKYNLLIMGTKGTFKATPSAYEMVYIKDGENPERSVVETFLQNEAGEPIYCSEKLVKHEESGTFDGTAFDVGTAKLYEQLYYKITEGKPMDVTPEMAAQIISVIETVHAENPLPLKY
jgi:predicted dehydrogenase